MRILIATPTTGSVVTQFMLSFLESHNAMTLHKQSMARSIIEQIPNFDSANPNHQHMLNQNLYHLSYDVGLYTLAGESLLQRGRNHCAQVALTGGWDKLMFIDSDAQWTWPQLKKIFDSPHPLTAGLCPLKVYPISLNYLPFKEDEDLFVNAERSMAGTKKLAERHGSSLVKVPFVGTAFMCISTEILVKMAEKVDHFIYPNPYTGQPESHWDFFKVHSLKNTYLSEDWSFCYSARQLGYDVYVDTDVVIKHIGNHTFQAI